MEYQKKSQREHILLRPEPYVGSMQEDTRDQWTVDAGTGRMQLRSVTYIPALLHLYDEILVNAADNAHRNTATARMSRIDIDIAASSSSSSAPLITVRNDGACIPTVLHPTEGCYVPELIFGHLLTSSNYDDSQQRFTGGRHGFGAKLTNILSSAFSVELADSQRRLHYAQTWTDNMTQRGEPQLRPWTAAEKQQRGSSFTSVSFTPDLRRFGQQRLSDDVVLLMQRRAYDIAACVSEKGVKVRLNGKELPIASFPDYVALFPLPADAPPLSFSAPHWHVTVAPLLSSSSSSQSRDISFVNSISTSRGGSHCQFIADKLSRVIVDHLLKHEKQLSGGVSPQLVRQSFSLFINCEVANPAFDSQTKETLITPVRDLPPVTLPPAFVRSLLSSPLLSSLVEQLETRQTVELQRKTRQSRHRQLLIPKLDDAILAGSSRSSECTLILTEGDSAKALVLAGMSELGRDRWGVFPLRGKMLNVRDVSGSVMMRNEEIQHVARIIGLEYGKVRHDSHSDRVWRLLHPCALTCCCCRCCAPRPLSQCARVCVSVLSRLCKVYSTPASMSSLRYGSVMLMTDQDADGSHIKGLFINLLHSFWPSLLQQTSFLQTFSTAIVKARKGRQQLSFDSLLEYRRWREGLGEDGSRRWAIKYYKGLGTNSAEEGREYFRSLQQHRIGFLYTGQQDDSSIEMAFSKAAADRRKTWLQSYDPELTPAYVTAGTAPAAAAAHAAASSSPAASSLPVRLLPYAEFINKELILFSHADNVRSIPSVLDGLKPVQRKILFAAFKRGLTGEIKVAQLAGYVSEQTGYHHGEASLSAAIVGMAQAYTGSNNLPLLFGSGQFGTRHMGGKDAASSRYIFTRLESAARLLFDARDDGLLQHRDEDGLQVEPESYVPIIPFALVNGAEGIGTGFSTSIPAYHPLHIIRILRRRLTAGSTAEQTREEELTPWLRDHAGVVRPGGSPGLWLSEGVVRKLDAQRVEITELPWGRWTTDYKDWLMTLMSADASGPFVIRRVTEYHTNEKLHFRVELSRDNVNSAAQHGPAQPQSQQAWSSICN